jgi:prepilin-type N-terminal cleavage/methylation domain-containing protein
MTVENADSTLPGVRSQLCHPTLMYSADITTAVFLKVIKESIQMLFSRKNNGFSMIEVMLAVALTCIIALGTMGYHYLSIKHGRATDAQFMASRIAQLLLEDWKGESGDEDYDPESLRLGFAAPESGEYGSYVITLGNIPFYIDMDSTNVDSDAAAGVTLRQIAVTVKWRNDYTRGAIRARDPMLTFTTYVRRDQG